ncbi:MAG: PLD nuclease N-terminal domain-containing protein [Bacillota bacterium]
MVSRREILMFLPLVFIQLVLMIAALLDLKRRERVAGPRWLWVLVIVFISTLGPLAYFVFGRKD